jgi:hypothetical protein
MGWRPQVADTEFHVGEAVKPEAMVKPGTTVKPKTSPNPKTSGKPSAPVKPGNISTDEF